MEFFVRTRGGWKRRGEIFLAKKFGANMYKVE